MHETESEIGAMIVVFKLSPWRSLWISRVLDALKDESNLASDIKSFEVAVLASPWD